MNLWSRIILPFKIIHFFSSYTRAFVGTLEIAAKNLDRTSRKRHSLLGQSKCEKSELRKTSLVYGKQGTCKISLSFPCKLCGFFNRVAVTGKRMNIINVLIGFYLASDGMKNRGTVPVCGTQRTFQSALHHHSSVPH